MSETYDNKAVNGKELAEQTLVGVASEIKREGYVSAAAFNDVVARLVALEKAMAEQNIGDRIADSLDAQSLKVGGTDVKTKQAAKSNPSASSGSATTFVDTLSQDENGVMTATRRPMKMYTGTGSNTDAPMTQKATSDALATKAPIASPTFTGTPAAPTAVASTDTTQLATTAFVHDAIENDLKKAADVSGMGNDDTHAYSGEAVSMAISQAVSGNVGGFLGNMTVAQMNAYTTPKMGDNAIVTDTGTITVGSEQCVIITAPSEVRWTTSGSWKISSAGYVRDTQIATTSTAGIVKTNSADGGVSLNASNQMEVNGWSGKQDSLGYGTSGQYLKSNGVNNAPSWDNTSNMTAGGITNASYNSGYTGPESNWSRCIKIDLKSARGVASIRCLLLQATDSNAAGFVDIIIKSKEDNSWDGVSYVTRSELSNSGLGNVGYYQTGTTVYLGISMSAWGSLAIPMLMGKTGNIDVTFGDYTSIMTSEPLSTMLPSFINTHAPINTAVGSTSIPVHVDTDGSVKACDPSQMSVGTTQNVATQGAASNSFSRHVWFSDSSTETKRAHDDNLKYTPATNTISANISGSAASIRGKKIVVGSLGTDSNTIYFLTGA